MIRYTIILTILISLLIVGSQENQDDIVSSLVDGVQQQTNITCLCTDDEQCESNGTCRLTHSDHTCYESWTRGIGDNRIHVTAGCVYNDIFFTLIFCNGNETNRYIICCSEKHYCNDRDEYSSDIRKQFSLLDKSNSYLFKIMLSIIGLIILLLLSSILIILFLIKRKRHNSPDYKKTNESNKYRWLLKYFCPRLKNSTSDVIINDPANELSRSSSGCGRLSEGNKLLKPYLIRRTLTKQITLEDRIGIGGYGCVYRGRWYGRAIAVKIFPSSEEPSWGREVEIYNTPGLNHDNILRYIAADNTDISDRIELWLATEYHENGSVYDYLMNHTITPRILTKMILSIVDGLWCLHLPIDATRGKVAFAHRDLKTKNILVKRDLSCCIADLGLAVKEEREKRDDNDERVVIDIKANHRAGTVRYMAPEILNKTLNVKSFESYKAADVYALGLVFWEILRRCQTTPEENDADAYELPYQDVLPNNSTFEQMHEIVCVRKLRPSPSPRWKNNPILDYMFDLCQELWSEDPVCRPNTHTIKTQLDERFESIDYELSNSIMKSGHKEAQTV